jgi:4-aminobutyrate aminotransferase-like enzyme
VASVGHANPEVVEAVRAQMSRLSTHTRYLQRGVVEFAEQLLATFPAHIGHVMFTNSGSEANDLALRVARTWTGGTGVVVTAEAYHGTTDLLATVSPSVHATFGTDPGVRVVPRPSARLAAAAGQEVGDWFADQVDAAFQDMRAHGTVPSAFLADSIFSSDGIYPNAPGFLKKTIDVVHGHGALFISDEVQPGYTRTGETFWGFMRHGVEADLVTCGKPMGNGLPVAALAGRAEVLARFGRDVPYFNTFGGSSVPIAAAQAVLTFVQREDLLASVHRTGTALRDGIDALTAGRPDVDEVRGAGLYLGVELVDAADAPDSATALRVVNEMRRRHVLISVAGQGNNVLKIRPPLVFGDAEVATFLDRFADTLDAVDRHPRSPR